MMEGMFFHIKGRRTGYFAVHTEMAMEMLREYGKLVVPSARPVGKLVSEFGRLLGREVVSEEVRSKEGMLLGWVLWDSGSLGYRFKRLLEENERFVDFQAECYRMQRYYDVPLVMEREGYSIGRSWQLYKSMKR